MSLYSGPRRDGVANIVQEVLLRIAFLMQDVGSWLVEHGRRFEDWVCPSGHRAQPPPEPYWRMP